MYISLICLPTLFFSVIFWDVMTTGDIYQIINKLFFHVKIKPALGFSCTYFSVIKRLLSAFKNVFFIKVQCFTAI